MADETMRRRVYGEARELGVEGRGDVIIGNWTEGARVDGRGSVELNLLFCGGQAVWSEDSDV